MAAWVGVTPKQFVSGNQSRMGPISKRGNRSLRTQLIHGTRAVVLHCENKNDPLNLWIQRLLRSKAQAIVIVAVANKLARIAWAILSTKTSYNAQRLGRV